MSTNRTGAWLMWSFYEIVSNQEKQGGRKRPDTSFLPFKLMLNNCGMMEFPYKGNSMSWIGYKSLGKVQCRLDRAVGKEDWHQLFSHTNVEYLKLWGSDHRHVLTRIQSRSVRLQRCFKFEKKWLHKDGLKEAIETGWGIEDTASDRPLHVKINDVRCSISQWKRDNPSNTAKKIETIKEHLERSQADPDIPSANILNLKWNLCTAFREEELYWKKKSRAL